MRTKRTEPTRLSQGKAFHKEVQADWRANAQGKVEPEKLLTKLNGRRGFIDIFVGGHDSKALVEIKGTDWDRMTDNAVRRNVRRQIRQVWGYVDAQPDHAEGVCPGVIFPKRPRNPERLRLIESMFNAEAIQVVWEDETLEERRSRSEAE